NSQRKRVQERLRQEGVDKNDGVAFDVVVATVVKKMITDVGECDIGGDGDDARCESQDPAHQQPALNWLDELFECGLAGFSFV
ncbi:MAG: hypothetical protein E7K68_02620, partial [Corynebacterium kroppenstedtii]|nr:hypothetical protein [Corynebacterium kroppenstedtii]